MGRRVGMGDQGALMLAKSRTSMIEKWKRKVPARKGVKGVIGY
jgi:hypothetical protein